MSSRAEGQEKSSLALQIFVAIVLAIGLGLLAPGVAQQAHLGGEIFLRLLKMLVVPLVMASVMSGILGMGDVRRLGRPGGYTLVFYLVTTVVAVGTGLILVNIIQPGVGAFDPATLEQLAQVGRERVEGKSDSSVGTILSNLALMLFTDNLIGSMAKGELLPLILFSMIFAGMLTTMGARVSSITRAIGQINDALLSFIMLLMKVAPLGIFCLVAARFGKAQAEGQLLEVIRQTGMYSLTILAGLAIHALVTLPAALYLLTRRNPFRYLLQMSPALLTAFSTASSSATLPVTLETVTERGGVSRRAADFVIPLGATINMNGTALYEAVAPLFIAQAIGMHLDLQQQLVVAVTATLAAIGAAGIPEAGLVTMLIVLNAVGLPTEYIGLILSVDWLLDRFRTAVNVLGDMMGAAAVESSFEKIS